MFQFYALLTACTAIVSAAGQQQRGIQNSNLNSVEYTDGTSLMQSSKSIAVVSVPSVITEDIFGDLEDSFGEPAIPQKTSTEMTNPIEIASFFIACTQDVFIMAVLMFLLPFVAGRLILPPHKKQLNLSVESQETDVRQQSSRRELVNFGELMRAARSCDEAQWRSALKALPDRVRAVDRFGCTALHIAADAGCVEMAKELLEAGADVQVRDTWEETPLHFAARKGSFEMCELLLAKGAELDATNFDGVTPLVAAARACNESSCQLLLDRGATCGGLPDTDVPALLSSLLMYKMIVPQCKSDTDISAESQEPNVRHLPSRRELVNFGELMRAARSCDEAQWGSALKALPDYVRAVDRFGCTALHIAADAGCVKMAKELLEAGADVQVRDTWEETPLHFAARKGSFEMCELLLAKGAELDAINSDGVTPLVAAARACNESSCQLLLDRGATCGGLPDADVPALLSSLLMYKMILPQC
jgi:ankyrin repeat protein